MSTASTRPRSRAERGSRRAGLALACALFAALASCASPPGARVDASDAFLLDVEIVQLDPGKIAVAEEQRSQIATLLGLESVEAVSSIDIRRAEARYIPVHLKRTLQAAGPWGSIWVVPEPTGAVDLTISGTIRESDGERLALDLQAVDASGATWVRRSYTASIGEDVYLELDETSAADPAQALYDEVAADLEAELRRRSGKQLRRVRDIAELRFAQRFASDAFDGYLERDGTRVRVRRLPARSDPMLRRVRQLAARDQLFLDALNTHYDRLYDEMGASYLNWRRYTCQEVTAFRELVNSARLKILGGTALVVGGLVAGHNLGGDAGRILRLLMAGGGVVSLVSGFSDQRESNLHAGALKELGTSFDGSVAPLVVSIDQDLVRLTGTAEEQYAKWKRILKDLYDAERELNAPLRTYVENPAPPRQSTGATESSLRELGGRRR